MARGGVKLKQFSMDGVGFGAFLQLYRRILYVEIEDRRHDSGHDSTIHFYLLNDGMAAEYEINSIESERDFQTFVAFLERYVIADFFRSYRFYTAEASYRVLVRKGIKLDANNDLGGFVYQNYNSSLLISPRRREVFERMQADAVNFEDGVAQLVRVGRLLKDDKFRTLHEQYFGKIGIASLNDGSTIKHRYADSIANNNVVTDMGMFREYLDCVNTIPMSSFTQQNIISQLANGCGEIKQVLMDNYSNFLFMSEDEIDFACIILGLFLNASKFDYSAEDWVRAINYVRYLNNDTFLHRDDSELDCKRELGLFRAHYVLERVTLPKLVHFLYDFFDFTNLSRNIGTFYKRLNDLLGEDIREKFSHLETINVSLKSLQASEDPCGFFKYPQLVNFATAADKEVQKQIIGGEYNRAFATFYLCNYMQVADYKSYVDVLPAVVSIIKNLDVQNESDFNLFWIACDVLNEFRKCIPENDEKLRGEIEKMIYGLFWPRIGEVWPIAHRKEVKFENEAKGDVFRESLGWIMAVSDKLYPPKLRKYLKDNTCQNTFDVNDFVDKELYYRRFAKQKARSMREFMKGHTDDESWGNAAVWCDDISDEDILSRYVFDANNGVFVGMRQSVLEAWLLKGHDAERLRSIKEYFINQFDVFWAFCKDVCNSSDDVSNLVFNTIAAMCESASNVGEDKAIEKFAQKAMASDGAFATKYAEKIDRMLAVARANIRRVAFQNKKVDAKLIAGLY